MLPADLNITPSTETGKLNVMHLKRYWNKSILKREGKLPPGLFHDEWAIDTTLLKVLGLGLEQTMMFVYHESPSFEQFETWITAVSGNPDAGKIEQFNRLVIGGKNVKAENQTENDVLTADDLAFWKENGYVIIREAISKADSEAAVSVICQHLDIDRSDSSTWYKVHPSKQGIMIQLFQHPLLDKNRNSPKIRRAYEQLWNRTDLWVNTDRVGFNPPENKHYQFPGPRLHWDSSIKQPMPFGTQGILYLADTAANQGAFTLVPGFQRVIGDWLNRLPEGADPRKQDLYALGPVPIAANAGDFILWHHALPHGSSANTSALPRFVQYINYEPFDYKETAEWV
ncbi:phytanoyl-CoA dioxygenase family protein [uncultured Mucilaginibacter sp.]|uniref:phytanoyl-CoA dioxygenase family protein n=1 Tax=uncultured Mucilaginibacter sp. TaxID=797541 RepID=UPI0026015F22|nr:phytanoyl-CoA dioxygenase family protein [uncultured Mucilaginibacter sp.]